MSEPLKPAERRPDAGQRRRRSSARLRLTVIGHGLLVALLAVLGSLVWAPAASAHDELLDLQPGNKVVLSTPPTEVQMVFGAPVLSLGTQLRVTGPKGNVVSTGPASVNQGNVVQKLTGGLDDGVYRVDWRVTASDGHPVSGMYTFTLKAAAPASSPASVTSTASATASASATATASVSASPSSAASTASTAGGTGNASSSGSGSSAGLAVGVLVAAAAVGGIAFALLRRGKGASVSNEGNQDK